jgi:hypothetical protein
MNPETDDRRLLVAALRAAGPYLSDLVLVGGWAFRLYALRSRDDGALVALATKDADFVLPPVLPPRARTLRESLEVGGFNAEYTGDESPPVSHFVPGTSDVDFYVEFLVPEVGRPGAPTATISGITAQRLRHLDLLRVNTRQVELSRANGFDTGDSPLVVRVPNPAAFLVHKLLVLDRRKPEKQHGDIIYIHDTLWIFSDILHELREDWLGLQNAMAIGWIKRLQRRRTELFAGVTDLIRSASLVAAATGRRPTPDPERIRSRCQEGLSRIFDDMGPEVAR